MKSSAISKFVCVAILMLSVFQINAQQKNTGIDISQMDKSVSPKEDFYQFVNGTWLKNAEIPADKTSWGIMNELYEKTNKDALNILMEASANPKYGSDTDQGKAINLYKSIMDTVGRNDASIKPLKPYLAKIDAIKSIKDLQKTLMEMEPLGGIGFFYTGIGADGKLSTLIP